MKLTNKILLFSATGLVLSLGACKKDYLDRFPSDEAPMEDVFKTTDGAQAALQGLHRLMYRATDEEEFGQGSISLINDMMGEDMVLSDYGAGWFISSYQYSNSRSGGGSAAYAWTFYYQMIHNANEILANVDGSEGPQEVKDNIKGQAYYYRAFAYFKLSQLFQFTIGVVGGNVPGLPIYTEPTQEGKPRASLAAVYERIHSDLADAEALLTPFGGQRRDKSDISIDVVNGLIARVALFEEEWPRAAEYANRARQNYTFMDIAQVNNGFNDWNNVEWIWASRLVEEQTNNTHSFIGQIDVDAGVYAALGQQKLINRLLYLYMGDNDARKGWWYETAEANYLAYNQKKFQVRTPGTFANDMVYMRAAEMALIEAEALANDNRVAEAAQVLEDLMANRDPDFVAPVAKNDLLKEIWYQRRIELWGEGFRFPDIKRSAGFAYLTENEKGLHREGTGARDAVVGSTMTITDALDTRFLYRIPSTEINTNPNMTGADQNP